MKKKFLALLLAMLTVVLLLPATALGATPDYFYVQATDGDVAVGMGHTYDTPTTTPSLEYSTNGTEWTDFTPGTTTVLVTSGTKVFFRNKGTAAGINVEKNKYWKFTMTTANSGTAQVGGNIMYLLDQTGAMTKFNTDSSSDYAFNDLFSQCAILTDASDLILPATTLAEGCYRFMFSSCTALVKAPELPATTLAKYCYNGMFADCTALVNAPTLPAETLVEGCYWHMFRNCNNLSCIKVGFTAWDSNTSYYTDENNYYYNATDDWVANPAGACSVAVTGTFLCPFELDTTTQNAAHVPTGWTVNPFRITATGGAVDVGLSSSDDYAVVSLEYSFDGVQWDDFNDVVSIQENKTCYFRRHDNTTADSFMRAFTMTTSDGGTAQVGGNIMYLLDKTGAMNNFTDDTNDYAFAYLFERCTLLTDASELILPATTLATKCYSYMFYGCTALKKAPELPATTLATECYSNMFYGCTSLETAPALPATTLANYCYNSMFNLCTALKETPALPATTLAEGCYQSMFSNCYALETAPALPATTLANSCYKGMFQNCSKLETAPELPAETLATSCYQNMFYGCEALATAPALPAETLAQQCYYYMFCGCEALGTAPALPATALADSCYFGMFCGCTDLTTAPALPAAVLLNGCYAFMFQNCTSLEIAPELPATTLAQNCYQYMFQNCSKLDYIKVGFIAWNDVNDATASWVDGVADAGEFFCPDALETDGDHKDNASGVPEGWTVKKPNCFHITATGGDVKVGLSNYSIELLDYSSDGVTWTLLTASNGPVNIPSNATFYFRSHSDTPVEKFAKWGNNISFSMVRSDNEMNSSATAKIGGNIMYLLDKTGTMTDFVDGTNDKAFAKLFRYCKITDASELILPADTLAKGCYEEMFSGCETLEKAPKLPAMKLAPYCYSRMFYGCTSLEAAPELPATTLAEWCYSHMFDGCTSLEAAPELLAADLAEWCYEWMFENCTSLVNVQDELSATDLKEGCYDGMFGGCASLVDAPALPADTMVKDCYVQMFETCTSLTTAPKLPAKTLVPSCYNLMFNGCTNLVNAPDLPAAELKDGCYESMFQNCTSLTTAPDLMAKTLVGGCYTNMFMGCTSLNRIKVGFSQWDTTNEMTWGNATYNWVGTTELDGSFGVADKGTFICPKDLTQTFDANHIPVNWTVETPRPSGGGSSTPTVTVPVNGDGSSVKVSASVSGSTATVKDIKDADLAKVTGGEIVEIDLSGLKKNIDTAKIPTTTVEKIGEQAGMSVKLSTATVTFDQTATQEISDQAKGNTVELVVDDIKEVSLNAVQKESVKKLDTALIIDAYLVSNGVKLCTEGKGGFGGGKATVVLPYEIKNNRTPANYSVFYVDDAGKLQKLNAVYDKELAAFVFEIEHFSVYAVAYDENGMPFTDVAAGEYFYDAVKWAVASGITDGTDATHFSPNAPVTRAQVVTFLWRAAGKPVVNYAMNMSDVKSGEYYSEAVRWALAEGITKGTDTTTFSPDEVCTRGQIVTFLARFAGVKDEATGYTHDFTDVKAADYFNNAVAWAKDNKVTEGTSATTFSPYTNCNRAQVVTFLYRWMVK